MIREAIERSSRSAPLRWTILVLAGTCLPFAGMRALGLTVVWRDTAKLFDPVRELVVQSLRDARLPLWNPHEALGMPLLAEQIHAVLHPVSIAAALLAPGAGIEALAVAYAVLAAFGAGVLAKRLGASPSAAAVAALGYGLSGYVLGMTSVIQYLGAAATAPWAVAAIRAAGEGARFGVAAAAIAVACLAFAGEPQWAIVAVVLGSALALEAGGVRGGTRAFAGIALGAMIGAVQLIPAWTYFGESVRAAGVVERERALWAFAPWRTLELIAPGFFGGRPGGPVAPVYYALGGGGPYGIPFVTSAFVGAVLLALAIPGARATRAGKVLAGAALVSLWIAFGQRLDAEQLLHRVPVWGAFRYSEKLLGPFTLCVAVLAALGADRLSAWSRRASGVASAAAGACALGAILLLAVPATGVVFGRAAADAAALARERLGVGLLHAAGALAVLSTIGFVSRNSRVNGRTGALAAALVLVQSAAASPFALHAGPRGVRDAHALEALHGATPVRIAVPVGSISSKNPEDSQEFERLSAVESRMGVPSYNDASGVDDIEPYTGLVPGPFARVRLAIETAFGPLQMWTAWRRFGLTNVVVGPVDDDESRAIVGAAVSGGIPVASDARFGIEVFEVPHRPWALFAGAVIPAVTVDDATRKLVDALEAGDEAIVLEDPAPRSLAPGSILRVSRGRERVEVEAVSSGDALLVMNDAFWPGWEATVDGRPVPILRADALVRAVPWPSGRHVLEMRYAPREVTIGIDLTAAGCVALAVLVVLEGRPRRRSPAISARRVWGDPARP